MDAKITGKNLKATEKAVKLNDAVWGAKVNPDLVAQVVNVYRSNKRSSNASVKDRGQVSGGGRKPWRQKGTGRARHGSTRSPIWVGGGVTFGPTGRNWKRTVNKKMKLAALASVLSERLAAEEVYFVDGKNIDRKLVAAEKSALVVTNNPDVYKAVRNVEKVAVQNSSELNALDAMSGRKVFFDVESIEKLEERYSNGK